MESRIRWHPNSCMRRGNFGGKGHPFLGTFCRELCGNGCTDRFAVWVVDLGGPKEARVQSYSADWVSMHNFNRIRQVVPMYPTTLPWAVQKWPNWSICRLGCGLVWAEGSTSSIIFVRWRQCPTCVGTLVPRQVGTLAPPGEYDCSGNAVLCQITLTTCCCSCCCCFVCASVDWLYVDFLQLALIQTNSVISRLQSFFPSLKFEVGKVSCKINYLIYIVCVR